MSIHSPPSTSMSKDVLILLDADVIIHFLHAEKFTLLNELYPNRLRTLDIVVTELNANRTIGPFVPNLFRFGGLEEIQFPTATNQAMFAEFLSLKSTIDGKGERACLSYCRHNNHIIASSNTKDIVPYCTTNSIAYLTTLDLFCIAIHREHLTRSEVNALLQTIKSRGSRLKCFDIEEYETKYFDKQN